MIAPRSITALILMAVFALATVACTANLDNVQSGAAPLILNHNFESQSLRGVGYPYASHCQNWQDSGEVLTGNVSMMLETGTGANAWANAGQYEGEQVALSTGAAHALWQTLDVKLAADTSYTLSSLVGWRRPDTSWGLSGYEMAVIVGNYPGVQGTNWEYVARKVASDPLYYPQSGNSIRDSVTGSSTGMNPKWIGRPLVVLLLGGSDTPSNSCAWFDDVALSDVAPPPVLPRLADFGKQWVRSHDFTIKSWYDNDDTVDLARYLGCGLSAIQARSAQIFNQVAGTGLEKHVLLDDVDVDNRLINVVYTTSTPEEDNAFSMRDECPNDLVPRLVQVANWLRQNRPNALTYNNVANVPGSTNYSLDMLNPDAHMFDYYPIQKAFPPGYGDPAMYPYLLKTVRDSTMAHGIPFFTWLQSFATTSRIISESELRWMAFSALTTGSKGLGYFLWEAKPQFTSALMVNGVPSAMYDSAQTANPELSNQGKVLRFLESTDVRWYPGGSFTPTGWENWNQLDGLARNSLRIYAPDGYVPTPYAQWNVSVNKVANPIQTLQYDWKATDTWANASAYVNDVYVMTADGKWNAMVEGKYNYATGANGIYLYGGSGGYSGEIQPPAPTEQTSMGVWFTTQVELNYTTGKARARYGLKGGAFSAWTALQSMYSTAQPTAVRFAVGGTVYFDNIQISTPAPVIMQSENFDSLTPNSNWTGNGSWSVLNQLNSGGPGGPYTSASAIRPPSGDSHIIGISVPSAKDIMLGFFADDADRRYFMLTNQYCGGSLSASQAAVSLTVTFDSSVSQVHRQSRTTGQSELVNLTNHTLNLTLPGGTGDLLSYTPFDLTPPTGSIVLNGGALTTTSPTVTLTLSATDNSGTVSGMRFGYDGKSWSAWEPYGTTKQWQLGAGNGLKTVYVQFRDGLGNASTYSAEIALNASDPSVLATGLNINISLPDFVGDFALSPIRITLRQGATVVLSEMITPAQAVTAATYYLVPGTYTVAAQASKCLSKSTTAGVTTGVMQTVNLSLANGDLGGNNSITSTDVGLVIGNLDKKGN